MRHGVGLEGDTMTELFRLPLLLNRMDAWEDEDGAEVFYHDTLLQNVSIPLGTNNIDIVAHSRPARGRYRAEIQVDCFGRFLVVDDVYSCSGNFGQVTFDFEYQVDESRKVVYLQVDIEPRARKESPC
jgi:hypothetical protein